MTARRFILLAGSALALVTPLAAADPPDKNADAVADETLAQARIKTQSDAFDLQKKRNDATIDSLAKITAMRGDAEVKDGAGKIEAGAMSLAHFTAVAETIANAVVAKTLSGVPPRPAADPSILEQADPFALLDEAKLCAIDDQTQTMIITGSAWQPDVVAMLTMRDQYSVLISNWSQAKQDFKAAKPFTQEDLKKYQDKFKEILASKTSDVFFMQTFPENNVVDVSTAPPSVGGAAKSIAPVLGIAGAVLSAFKTDVSVAGIALAGGDELLINALVSAVRAPATQPKGRTAGGQVPTNNPEDSNTSWRIVRPDMVPRGAATDNLVKWLGTDMSATLKTAKSALAGDTALAKGLAKLTEAIADASDTASSAKKAKLKALQQQIDKATEDWAAAQAKREAAFDALTDFQASNLFAGKDKPAPIVAAAAALEQLCLTRSKSLVLRVAVSSYGGSSYVRKNLWTSFGGTPWFVSSGVVATYAAYDGATGNILAAGNATSLGEPQPIRSVKGKIGKKS